MLPEPLTTTFVCGCGHSGTSLVANMLAAHPAVFVPTRETETFLDAGLAVERWRALQAEWAASGRPHLAEKTPRHLLCLDRIRALVSRPRFVLLVRDGRDVAASFIKRFGRAEVGARRWLAENRIVRDEARSRDVQVLRYEDVVTEPEQALRDLCRFAGLAFEPAMLEYHRERRMWFGVDELRRGTGKNGSEHRTLRNWQINQPLFDDRGKWRSMLSAGELAPFETPEAQALLRTFGYEAQAGV